jgi:hypothetical protein
MLIYLLLVAVGGTAIGSLLYAALRPTVLINPGVTAYRPPVPAPLIPLKAIKANEAERIGLSNATAERENELIGLDPTVAFAASPTATEPLPEVQPPRVATQKQQRNRHAKRRNPREPNRWAAHGRDAESWFW